MQSYYLHIAFLSFFLFWCSEGGDGVKGGFFSYIFCSPFRRLVRLVADAKGVVVVVVAEGWDSSVVDNINKKGIRFPTGKGFERFWCVCVLCVFVWCEWVLLHLLSCRGRPKTHLSTHPPHQLYYHTHHL